MKKLVAGVMTAILLVSLTATPGGAATITATIVTENVVLNGISYNNTNARYPLLRYRNITYFPLTYDLCRFLGLSSHWSQRNGLQVTRALDSVTYVPDEGTINRSGNVSVTIPTYGIEINGKRITNSGEPWPLINYKGITYFPLTWRFAVGEFGWSYNWSAEEGLRINSTGAVSDALENLLAIVNKSSFVARILTGTLLDKGANSIEDFTSSIELVFSGATATAPPRAYLIFHSAPFVFAGIGTGFVGTGLPSIDVVFENKYPASNPHIQVSGPYVGMGGAVAGGEFARSEKAYLLRCFLKLRFIGEQRASIISTTMLSSSVNTETWQLVVDMPDDGFFARPVTTTIKATIVLDTLRGRVLKTELENEHYRLEMTIID